MGSHLHGQLIEALSVYRQWKMLTHKCLQKITCIHTPYMHTHICTYIVAYGTTTNNRGNNQPYLKRNVRSGILTWVLHHLLRLRHTSVATEGSWSSAISDYTCAPHASMWMNIQYTTLWFVMHSESEGIRNYLNYRMIAGTNKPRPWK